MKAGVVFAVSLFDANRAYVLREFLSTFKSNFSDSDLYIGINYGSISEVESIIEEYGLNTYITRVQDSNLYCGSDASAYQAALKTLKASNKHYDVYWFAHTKGAVNDRPNERTMYLSELFGNREYIENFMASNDMIGSYALRGVSSGAAGDQWATFNNDHDIAICSNEKYDTLQYTHVNWSYIETMYVIKKEVVETFLRLTTDAFYTTKIQDPCYFEITFPWLGSRCGYFPYIKEDRCFWGSLSMKNITADWITQNELYPLHKYLTL